MATTATNSVLQTKLHQIISNDNQNTIKSEVAREALEYSSGEEIKCFFSDLFHYGCINGTVSSLIYYADTHAFYDKHYAEIEEIRLAYQEAIGEPLRIEHDLKNTLAWFAFEQKAYLLAEELGVL